MKTKKKKRKKEKRKLMWKKKKINLNLYHHASLPELKRSHEDLYVLHITLFGHHKEVWKQIFTSEWILNLDSYNLDFCLCVKMCSILGNLDEITAFYTANNMKQFFIPISFCYVL